ncbi:choice-of-anchor Q domain-containing protein [Tundrisphaera sp. TA3]|uniref:choice-of-anchor Q domain-containing protein n=1 Tax=Tundrisphaera sp. TA3 TaxID=3435775 RepID=UPI003EBF87B5
MSRIRFRTQPCRQSRPLKSRRPQLEALEPRRLLAAITANSLGDTDARDAVLTLREAILVADGGLDLAALSPAERAQVDPLASPARAAIGFAPSVAGTIRLERALPALTGRLSVAGPGAASLTVTRSTSPGAAEFRIFHVLAGADVALSGITIVGGRSDRGAGILNSGSLTLDDGGVLGNEASSAGALGGGIANFGTLTVTNSLISGNRSQGGGALGGGIANFGTLTVTNSLISGNRTEGGGALGGGIHNAGKMTIVGTELANNTVLGGGSSGGGINNSGSATLVGVDVTGNIVAGAGAGINNNGALTVIDSEFVGSGSLIFPGQSIINGGTATVVGSTFVGGTGATGVQAIINLGTLAVTNSTFSDFPSSGGNVAIDSQGTSRLTVSHSTFGDAGIFAGGAASVKITASLFTQAAGSTIVLGAPATTFVSGGHNLFSDRPAVALDPSDLTDADPLLAPLGDYGGPTRTMALLPGSPAIDTAVSVAGASADQRGVPRPQGSAPDIGAFELAFGPFLRLTSDSDTELVGASHTVTATLLGLDFRPIAGVPVAFRVAAGPNAGASGTISPAGGLTNADGEVSFTFAGRGGVGIDTIFATATPAGGPAISSSGTSLIWTTLAVATTADSGPGSLRAAIAAADRNPGRDVITFAPGFAGTIALLSPLPDLSGEIAVVGPGASFVTVAADPAGFRVFSVAAGADASLSGLTISGGRADAGGGILNAGRLTVADSIVAGNTAAGFDRGEGGGIRNVGTLTIRNTTVAGNSSIHTGPFGSSDGGGVSNSGLLTIIRSTLSGNSAPGWGGGIYNDASGTLTVVDSTIDGNSIAGGFFGGTAGGGIANFGVLTLIASTLSGNSVEGLVPGGGGLSNHGTATLINATLVGNTATSASFGLPTGFRSSGGAISNAGTLTVLGSTLVGNSTDRGGGIHTTPGTTTVIASILHNPTGGNLSFEDGAPATAFVSGGHNLFSDRPAVALDPSDLTDTDPLLAPLGDYGGPTRTMALLPGSPAIDAGTASAGIEADQRGVSRRQGLAPDIGAFESRGFTIVIVAGDGQLAPAGAAFASPLVVAVAGAFGEPVAGGRVRFIAPDGPATARLDAASATIGADGRASVIATANELGGSYSVVAGAAGASEVAFALANASGATVVRLLVEPASPAPGRPITFTATVGGAPGATPTGFVTFREGEAVLAVVPLDADGRASFSTTALGPGPHAITAEYGGDAAFAAGGATAEVVVADGAAPRVASLSRFGFHARPTVLVLRFDRALDPTSAEFVRNYRIVDRRGQRIAVRSAEYDPASGTVTLRPSRRLDIHRRFRLTVIADGPSGVRGPDGRPLDGSGLGRPGSHYRTTISREDLILPPRMVHLRIRPAHRSR